ncbi:hypothetical protein acsn021_01570 [Anaerocolumna cellulosilytica]|uniref:Uncharacterized protein n=1 Tax=Anaerocolumna cellulosilytica TaxID=433286 RepID=A0A6S6R0S1_9FIRM|nr:hypothetical protein [Anaerocolumna cellulosilytica]MBB5197939.1 hypothetical protein [Anaerocolumna cellulosilytica]BCJ92588.1 hypothetical protein acsn021_01570 [Anaerocolumna cellulosilytica]
MLEIQNMLKQKLAELFPGVTIYEEDLPENHQKPSFHLQTTARQISRGLGDRENQDYSFDISYYSNVTGGIKKDCLEVGTVLLQELGLSGGLNLRNKKAETIEDVLHYTFNIRFVLQRQETAGKMQNQQINTVI